MYHLNSVLYINALYPNGQMNIFEIAIDDFSLASVKSDSNILSMLPVVRPYSNDMPQLISFYHIYKDLSQWEELCLSRREVLPDYILKLKSAGIIEVQLGNCNIFCLNCQPTLGIESPLGLENASNNNITFRFANKKQMRVHFDIGIRSPLVEAIMKVLCKVLPQSLFQDLLTDYLELSLGIKNCRLANQNEEGDFGLLKHLMLFLLQNEDISGSDSPQKIKKSDASDRASVFQAIANDLSDKAWSCLLKSQYHLKYISEFSDLFGESIHIVAGEKANISDDDKKKNNIKVRNLQIMKCLKTNSGMFCYYAPEMFKALHLLYEDIQICTSYSSYCMDIADMLFSLGLCISTEFFSHMDLYIRAYPSLLTRYNLQYEIYYDAFRKGNTNLKKCPSLSKWMCSKYDDDCEEYPLMFELSRKVCRLFEIMCGSKGTHTSVLSDIFKDQKIKTHLLANNSNHYQWFTQYKYISRIPMHSKDYYYDNVNSNVFEKLVHALLEENVNTTELNGWSKEFSIPILEVLKTCRENYQALCTRKWPYIAYRLIDREDLVLNYEITKTVETKKKKSEGLSPSQKKLSVSSITVFNSPSKDTEDMNAIDKYMQGFEVYKEILGNQVSHATKTYTFAQKPIEQHRFPNDLRYKEAIYLLESSKEIRINVNLIPEQDRVNEEKFEHEKKGLLYKLAIRQLSKCTGRGAITLCTTYTLPTEELPIPKIIITGKITQNDTKVTIDLKDDAKEKELISWPEFHNGVAAGLQLAKGFIPKGHNARNWILFQKPQTPRAAHDGFLFAMGLLGYLNELLPTDIYQYLKSVHETNMIGVLLGCATSKIGTMDDNLSRTLCVHIPFLLPPKMEMDIISIQTQSAAILGIGLLYKGTNHRLMTEMALTQIGKKPFSDKCLDREVFSLCAGICLGLINLGASYNLSSNSELNLNERLIRFVEGGKVQPLPQSIIVEHINIESNKCSSVMEGDNVNVHVTAPGALMALAFIHMKTNRKDIADRIEIPSSFYSIEQFNHLHLVLKIVTRNLIMWDNIQASEKWINNEIPAIISNIFESQIENIPNDLKMRMKDFEVNYNMISLCYLSIRTGEIMSIGLKYAGSANQDAMNVIIKEIEMLRRAPTAQFTEFSQIVYSNYNKNAVDRHTIDNCLCICAYSLSLVMAGTGDISTFRTLRVLRKRLEKDMNYGHNMAINQCIGFLFLGSGAYSFSTSNFAIACLLCSIYPYFPNNTYDNKYHLQAMRHFYVFAIEHKLLEARDVETNENINVKLKIEFVKNGQSIIQEFTTPAMLQTTEGLKKITSLDPNYFEIELEYEKFVKPIIYLKRKIPISRNTDDPNSNKDEFLIDFTNTFCGQWSKIDINILKSLLPSINGPMVKKMQIIKEIQRQLSIDELQRFNKHKHQCDDVMNECFNEMKLETLNHQLYFLLPNSKVATLHCVNHFYTEFYYFLWQSIADNKSLTIISPRQLSKLDAMWTEILTTQNKEWIYRYLSKCGFDSECSGQNEDGVKLMKKFASIIVYYSILNPFEMAKMRSDYLRQFQEVLTPLSNIEFDEVCKLGNNPVVNTLYALIFSKKSSLSEEIKNILVRGMIQLVKAFRQ